MFNMLKISVNVTNHIVLNTVICRTEFRIDLSYKMRLYKYDSLFLTVKAGISCKESFIVIYHIKKTSPQNRIVVINTYSYFIIFASTNIMDIHTDGIKALMFCL